MGTGEDAETYGQDLGALAEFDEQVAAHSCWECGAPDDAVILWESELGGYICEWCAGDD